MPHNFETGMDIVFKLSTDIGRHKSHIMLQFQDQLLPVRKDIRGSSFFNAQGVPIKMTPR